MAINFEEKRKELEALAKEDARSADTSFFGNYRHHDNSTGPMAEVSHRQYVAMQNAYLKGLADGLGVEYRPLNESYLLRKLA